MTLFPTVWTYMHLLSSRIITKSNCLLISYCTWHYCKTDQLLCLHVEIHSWCLALTSCSHTSWIIHLAPRGFTMLIHRSADCGALSLPSCSWWQICSEYPSWNWLWRSSFALLTLTFNGWSLCSWQEQQQQEHKAKIVVFTLSSFLLNVGKRMFSKLSTIVFSFDQWFLVKVMCQSEGNLTEGRHLLVLN